MNSSTFYGLYRRRRNEYLSRATSSAKQRRVRQFSKFWQGQSDSMNSR